MPRRPWPLAAAAGCAVLIAACGGGAAGTGTGRTNNRAAYSAALKFANCMRSHGVSDFPDPGTGGAIQVPIGSKRSPTFQAAARACSKYGPGPGGGSPPHISAAQRRKLLAFSECMRTHGIPSFPDPTFPSSGGAVLGGPNTNLDRQSPVFQRAAAACGLPLK
jgi:hypothetical protein